MSFLRKYAVGSGADVFINIPKAGSANHAVSADWTPTAGDVKVSIDGAAAANVGTLPTAIAMGNSAIWKFVFTNGELTGKQINVTVSDSATKAVDDTGFVIETFGNASAMYPFDLGTASTAQTGDSYAIANSGTHGNAALKTLIDAISAKTTNLPTDPADASDVAAAVAALNDLSAAEVNAEVVDALATDTYAEKTGVPAYPASVTTMLREMYARLINPIDLTSSKKTFKTAAGVATWEKDLADDGTTYTESVGNAP